MSGNKLSALRFRNILLSLILILLCSLSVADAAVYTLEWDDDLNTNPEKPVYYRICWGVSPGNYKSGQSGNLSEKQYAFDQPDGLYFVSVRAFYTFTQNISGYCYFKKSINIRCSKNMIT